MLGINPDSHEVGVEVLVLWYTAIDPGLKAPLVSKFDAEKDNSAFNLNLDFFWMLAPLHRGDGGGPVQGKEGEEGVGGEGYGLKLRSFRF